MPKQKVSIYDPVRDAYFEADIETAKKFVAAAIKVEKKIKQLEGEK